MASNLWTDTERVEFPVYVLNKIPTKKIAHILCRTESAVRSHGRSRTGQGRPCGAEGRGERA